MPVRTPARVLAAAVLLVALATGCADGTDPLTSVSPSTATESPAELPWPADGAADAAALQADVDAGAQPWLLDPVEVSLSYAAAVHDWRAARATSRPAGPDGAVVVDVRDDAGDAMALTLRQPSRTGDGGIWVITSEYSG